MKVPIETVHLFPVLDKKLIALLRSLGPADWQRPTLARLWTVKDVAAHLLDGNVRAIAGKHQHPPPPPATPIQSYSSLVAHLNQLNASWVQAMQRVSPTLLTDMLETTGKQYSQIMAEADLFGPAPFGVAWAGGQQSANWFHIAREYTEKWHHQQQIRHAVGQENELMAPELFYPLIATLLCGLPHALRHLDDSEKGILQVTIDGLGGGDWFVAKENGTWRLFQEKRGHPTARLTLAADIAWKLFTKGMKASEAQAGIHMEGNEALCKAALEMIAVMA